MAKTSFGAAVIPPQAVTASPVKRARGARMGVLIGPGQGAPNFITRRFVLAPLAEIAPQLVHPLLGVTVEELLARCPDASRVERLAPGAEAAR